MADKYQNVFAQYIAEIYQQLDNEDESWRQSCHKIKSAAASLGLTEVFNLAGELEHAAYELNQLRDKMIQLEESNKMVLTQLHLWLNKQ